MAADCRSRGGPRDRDVHPVHECALPLCAGARRPARRGGRGPGQRRARSDADDEEAPRVGSPVGRPIVEAAAAFGAGDRARAAQLLDPVMPLMTSIGGSDPQDDLFRQTYLRSLQAAGRYAYAAAYAARMTGAKTRTPLDRVLA